MVQFFYAIFQSTCIHCQQKKCIRSMGLCEDCIFEVPVIAKRIDVSPLMLEVWAMGPYRGPVGTLIRRGKYRSDISVYRQMGAIMARACLDLPFFEGVVHVPTAWHRKWGRGFDQADILASEIAQFLDVPHYNVLRRKEWGTQAKKSQKDRKKKVMGRFACKDVPLPKRVLLVDDTITTGATLEGCVAELYQQGVEEVIAFGFGSVLL